MKLAQETLCEEIKKKPTSLFQFLNEEDYSLIPCYLEEKRMKAGEILCTEGDSCDFIAFIISGRLEIGKKTEYGEKQVILAIYGEGSMIGESSVIDELPISVTAIALEDTTLGILSRENLNKLLDSNPTVGLKFLKGMYLTVTIRLRKSFERLASIL